MDDMDNESFESENKMTFEMKKRMVEERIIDVKEGMRTLRLTMRQTTKEVRNIFHRVTRLQNLAREVTNSVKVELDEMKRIRDRKLIQHKYIMEKSKRLLDESKELIEALSEKDEDITVKMNGWLPGYSRYLIDGTDYGTIKRRGKIPTEKLPECSEK